MLDELAGLDTDLDEESDGSFSDDEGGGYGVDPLHPGISVNKCRKHFQLVTDQIHRPQRPSRHHKRASWPNLPLHPSSLTTNQHLANP